MVLFLCSSHWTSLRVVTLSFFGRNTDDPLQGFQDRSNRNAALHPREQVHENHGFVELQPHRPAELRATVHDRCIR